MSLNIPYVGPGVDDSTAPIQPDALTLKQQIEAYANTPAGTVPTSSDPSISSVGFLAEGTPSANAINSKANSLIYSPLANNGNTITLGLYNFTDPNCFPLAGNAKTTSAVVAATTTLKDLSSIAYPTATAGQQYATLYPNSATSGTAAPLSYEETSDGKCVGIIFTDNNALSVAESICINPYISGVKGSTGSQIPSSADDAMWMIAFQTPATLSTGTSASLFTIGSAINNTLQVAFTIVASEFAVYVNGSSSISYNIAPAASTRYALGVRWRKDPYNENQYKISLYAAVNGSTWPQAIVEDIPVPYQATPWAGYVANPLAQGDAGTTPISGFGPVAAFGGQWAFTALGYQAEELSVLRSTSDQEASNLFNNFAAAFSIVQ